MNNVYKITSNYDKIDWNKELPKLLPVLMSYAFKMIGSDTLSTIKNKSDLSYDFAMEAIKKYLERPNNFNPRRNPDLVKYLKYYILRQLISNFRKSKSHLNEDIVEENNYMGLSDIYIKDYLIDDAIDYDNLINKIKSSIKDDKLVKNIFELRIVKEFKRKEICEKLNIRSSEFDNGFRRLKTIVKKCMNSKVQVQ